MAEEKPQDAPEEETPEEPAQEEQEEEQELALPEESKEEVKEPETPSDPLDEITDVEELRKRAKGYRSAAQRSKKAVVEEKPQPVEEDAQKDKYLSREDFYKSNEKKAINALTRPVETDDEDAKASKQYIRDNWDKITQFYTPRLGKDTPEDIMDDLTDAVTLFRSKNPPEQESNAEKLAQTAGVGQPSRQPQGETVKEPPRFKIPIPPEEWYPDPKGILKKK